jgi:hypothetical protein
VLTTEFTRPDPLRDVAGLLVDLVTRPDLGEKTMSNNVVRPPGKAALAGDQALTIAQADASPVYRDLSPYRIQLVLEADGWHVDYELKDPKLKGGGPHYVIDADTGAILTKRYDQ